MSGRSWPRSSTPPRAMPSWSASPRPLLRTAIVARPGGRAGARRDGGRRRGERCGRRPAAGLAGVLVRTGKYRPEAVAASGVEPTRRSTPSPTSRRCWAPDRAQQYTEAPHREGPAPALAAWQALSAASGRMVTVRRLPRGRFEVRVRVIAKDGRVVTASARYRSCARRRPVEPALNPTRCVRSEAAPPEPRRSDRSE